MCIRDSDIIVASEGKLYSWSSQYLDDDGEPISYILHPKAVISANQILMKRVDTKFTADYAGTATLTEGQLSVPVSTADRHVFRCNHSTDCMDIIVKSNDRFTVDHIIVDVADL